MKTLLQSLQELAKLQCFLRGTAIPYYRAKEEVVNYEPRIAIFHDVISPTNIEHLKSIASKGVCFNQMRFIWSFLLYDLYYIHKYANL